MVLRVRRIRRHGKPSEPRPFSLVSDLAQPHRSHHGLITDFNIRFDAQIVHPCRIPAPERAAFSRFIFETRFLFP